MSRTSSTGQLHTSPMSRFLSCHRESFSRISRKLHAQLTRRFPKLDWLLSLFSGVFPPWLTLLRCAMPLRLSAVTRKRSTPFVRLIWSSTTPFKWTLPAGIFASVSVMFVSNALTTYKQLLCILLTSTLPANSTLKFADELKKLSVKQKIKTT